MNIPYLGLTKGDPLRSGGAGALAGFLTGAGWGMWAEANGADTEWYALALFLRVPLALAGCAVGALYGVFTLPSPGRREGR